MGRLIDVDEINFICTYNGNGDCCADKEHCKKCLDYMCDIIDIQNQPTAYDVDAVVKETRKKLDKLLHICALEDVEKVYKFYDSLEEIIRKGGVE
jgi:uncharacterized protein YerC